MNVKQIFSFAKKVDFYIGLSENILIIFKLVINYFFHKKKKVSKNCNEKKCDFCPNKGSVISTCAYIMYIICIYIEEMYF